jgi:hypothetical protein
VLGDGFVCNDETLDLWELIAELMVMVVAMLVVALGWQSADGRQEQRHGSCERKPKCSGFQEERFKPSRHSNINVPAITPDSFILSV